MSILIILSVVKYLFCLVGMGGVGLLLVYLFSDRDNKKLKRMGIRLFLVGFLVVILIPLLEMTLI